jgi:triacylglycerol lipase
MPEMPANQIHSIARIAAVVGLMALSGCSLHAKNVKPATPYDFGMLNQMAKYAQAAYADPATIRSVCGAAFPDVVVRSIAATNNRYFVASSTATRTQLIAIAGTANIENVLLDGDLTPEYVPGLLITLHRGFSRAARLIYDDVRSRLKPGYRVLLTGHSLGGAEAVILGMALKVAGRPVAIIVTFGQPKVTNQAGVDAFRDLPLTRVVNQNDVIPELPLEPFRHIGPELVLLPGPAYSVVEQRPLDPAALRAALQALRNHQPPAELPQHYIASYLADLEPKVTGNQLIPYP